MGVLLSCGLKDVRRATVGNTHCWGVVRAAVTCVMTSLKLFSFRNVENRLFSLIQCWITIIGLRK